LSPAIYNYDARSDEELSLQIGDTVHILETYEGETHKPYVVTRCDTVKHQNEKWHIFNCYIL